MKTCKDYALCHGNGDKVGKNLAAGLGWFSIGLGLLEVMAGRCLVRSLGMRSNDGLVRLYGVRELTTGIGILAAKDPTPWVWARVAGDVLDIGTLSAHLNEDNEENDRVLMALGNVAVVTALDTWCALRLGRHERVAPGAKDYSNRSGLPHSPQAMRGAASDFVTPKDMQTPKPLQPYPDGSETSTGSPAAMGPH